MTDEQPTDDRTSTDAETTTETTASRETTSADQTSTRTTADSTETTGESADETNARPPTASASNDQADQQDDTRGFVRVLYWAAIGILVLVALIATLRFYFAAGNAIDNFVTRQYRPIFQAVFNLVILLASGLGLSLLVRRIR